MSDHDPRNKLIFTKNRAYLGSFTNNVFINSELSVNEDISSRGNIALTGTKKYVNFSTPEVYGHTRSLKKESYIFSWWCW